MSHIPVNIFTSSFKNCLLLVAGISLAALSALGWFGYREDPFSIYHRPDYIPAFHNPARGALGDYSYVTKAAQIIRNKPDKILIGSSVMEHGFRIPGSLALWFDPIPEKTARIMALLPEDAKGFYNAAIGGGSMSESENYLHHAYANNPHLKEVILGLDWNGFTELQHEDVLPVLSALGHTHMPLAFTLEYLISPLALSKAFGLYEQENLQVASKAANARSGFNTWYNKIKSYIRPAAPETKTAFTATFTPAPSSAPTLTAGSVNIWRNYVFSVWFANYMRGAQDGLGEQALSRKRSLDTLRDVVAFCHLHHITLKLFIAPQHPMYWAMARHFGVEHAWERWMRDVTAIAPVYDAATLVDFAPDVDDAFPSDTLHFNEHGGEKLLPALTVTPTPATLVLTNAENVEARIRWRKQAISRWRATHPDIAQSIDALDVKFIIKAPAMNVGDPTLLLPAPYAPTYKGFILYSYMGGIIALPETLKPPFDLHRLAQKRYPLQLQAHTLTQMIHIIDASHAL